MWKPITLGAAMALAAGMSLTSAANAHQRGGGGEARFEAMDTNNDGAVTLAEMQAQAQTKFTEADTNNDGALTAAEMLAAAKRDGDRAERRVNRMIERRDANNDGKLQFSEVYNAERAAERFATADANSDGKLTKEEAGKMRGGRGKG